MCALSRIVTGSAGSAGRRDTVPASNRNNGSSGTTTDSMGNMQSIIDMIPGRVLKENGWVSYEMQIDSSEELYLGTTFFKKDIGKVLQIFSATLLEIEFTLNVSNLPIISIPSFFNSDSTFIYKIFLLSIFFFHYTT